MKLESGKFYWMRHLNNIGVIEKWQPVYIGEDPDERQWLHSIEIGVPVVPVDQMDLTKFEFVPLNPPSAYPTTCPICGGKLEADEEWLANEYGEHQDKCPVEEIPFECQQCGEVDTYPNLVEMAKVLKGGGS